ncbi:hypothetical protein TcasGA2_TC033765 [Tribolium castaneum]|uniref:Uncharacterized protein n=1 Tax=Tribolium castaneum TaxID=7070 RepID=A0A139WEZ2_TRICA|nr:hypothetical protein TcasGA2_TC033765 [Tribolium castaneum]
MQQYDGVDAVDTDTLRAVPQASTPDDRHSFLGSGDESIAIPAAKHPKRRRRVLAKLETFQVFQCVTFECHPHGSGVRCGVCCGGTEATLPM